MGIKSISCLWTKVYRDYFNAICYSNDNDISSVSSYIFEKEKGRPGLDVRDKEEKGYARWAKDKEIKTDRDVEVVTTTDEKTNAAGVPLAIDMKKNQIWVDNGEYLSNWFFWFR